MPDPHPNLVLIMTDQQRYDTIAALGFPYVDTPHLDRLVGEGVSFSNCFVTSPACVPSRASFFNGCYPHTSGVLSNKEGWSRSWVEDLARSGYHCVNVGKMHTVPLQAPAGFHERYVVENKDRFLGDRYFFDEWDKALAARGLEKQNRLFYRRRPDYAQRLGAFEWELPEETHSDVFVGNMATWWLDRHPRTEPLFLQIGFPGPHPPYDPIPRYAEQYVKRKFPILPVTAADLRSQPRPLRSLQAHHVAVDHDSVVHQTDPSEEQRHRQRAYYMASVAMIDEKVGEILQALERNGYLENSVVVFTSDHGDALGDHGHIQKWTMYDCVTRVPAIVWAPGRFSGGRTVDSLCQLFDLGPTLLALAGISPPPWSEAQSLVPALEGRPEWRGREYVFAEHGRDDILEETELMTLVRSRRWKLVHFLDSDEGQLFDLEADPHELNNLWGDPEAEGMRRELLDTLRDWLMRSRSRTKAWASDWR